MNGQGAKKNAFIYAGGQVIAQQFAVGTPWVAWQHTNPIMGDALNTESNSVEAARTTLDPLGVNTGDEDPFFDPGGGGESPISESAINQIVGSVIPWFGGPSCKVNGVITGCRFADSFATGDGAEIERLTQAVIYSQRDRRNVGFAFFNANQAAAGVSVFGLPVGWAPAGMGFTGGGFAFSSIFADSAFAAAAYGDLVANGWGGIGGLGGYLYDLASSGSASLGQVNELSGAYSEPQQQTRGGGEWERIDDGVLDYYREILETLLKKKGCKDFIDKYVGGANLLDVFDSVRGKGGYLWGDFRNGGVADGSGNQIALTKDRKWIGSNLKTEFYNTLFNINTLIHELIHSAAPFPKDSFMAKLLHDNGEASAFEFKGRDRFADTEQGNKAFESWSSV
ncbi:MAG: hypothetical protein ACRD6X_17525, partial [Pyrinomonadaceae bacterium]